MTKVEGRGRGRRLALLALPFAVGAAASAASFAVLTGTSSSAPSPTIPASVSAGTRDAVARTTTQYDAQTIYTRDSPGVVEVNVTEKAPRSTFEGVPPLVPGNSSSTQAEGSGFVFDRNGDIVTAAHVVTGASKITVTFGNGKIATATLVGSDPSSDTAVITVDAPSSELTPLALGDSAKVVPGEGVVAIGAPFGYPDSITAGIVSATGRGIQAPNGYTIPDAIQTDAAINHGNSGGPLIAPTGDVVGVNVQIATDGGDDNSGVGFAVPSNAVKTVVEDLIAGKALAYPYLGVSLGDSTSTSGAVIESVKPGSPAATAGLQAGDIVTAVDGAGVSDADQLAAAVAQHKPGDLLHLTVDRQGATRTIDVTLGTRPGATTT
jgi:putative serine protease PepD